MGERQPSSPTWSPAVDGLCSVQTAGGQWATHPLCCHGNRCSQTHGEGRDLGRKASTVTLQNSVHFARKFSTRFQTSCVIVLCGRQWWWFAKSNFIQWWRSLTKQPLEYRSKQAKSAEVSRAFACILQDRKVVPTHAHLLSHATPPIWRAHSATDDRPQCIVHGACIRPPAESNSRSRTPRPPQGRDDSLPCLPQPGSCHLQTLQRCNVGDTLRDFPQCLTTSAIWLVKNDVIRKNSLVLRQPLSSYNVEWPVFSQLRGIYNLWSWRSKQ